MDSFHLFLPFLNKYCINQRVTVHLMIIYCTEVTKAQPDFNEFLSTVMPFIEALLTSLLILIYKSNRSIQLYLA